MISKNNGLNGQGLAHPENCQSDIFKASEQQKQCLSTEEENYGVNINQLYHWREVAIMINRHYLIGDAHTVLKNRLPFAANMGYGHTAPAKSGAGIGVLECLSATYDAPSVFFCVVRIAHPFSRAAGIIRIAHKIMVGCSGAEKSAPVSDNAGYANPVQSTTSEIGVSGGGIKSQLSEAAKWLLPPPKNRNLFGLLPPFVVTVRRSSLLFTISLLFLSVKPAARWYVITSAFSMVACRFRRCAMFDNTPLDLEEIIDQCRALAYAAVKIDEPQAREILLFVLQERINHLYHTSQTEPEQAEVSHA
ncbi:ash family protein [Brenneria goodwinii]